MSQSICEVVSRVASCLVLATLLGCGGPKIDTKAKFDSEVERDWRKNWNWVDVDQFFKSGGLFMDSGDPEDPVLDRPHVLPLLRRLREKHGLRWQAVAHKKKTRFAVALVARLPSEDDVEKIEQTIDEEQKKFPGEILYNFGHRYMSIDFLTQEELEWEREAERKAQQAL